jgi:hypothetical protein
MKKAIVVAVLGLVGLVTVGNAQLSESALTKEKAKDVIEGSENYKPRKFPIPLSKTAADACVERGYFQWDTFGSGNKTSTALSVTDKGKQFFDSASGGKTAGSKQAEPLYAVSAVPIKPQVIEITNITDGDGGSKIVEYQWNWDPKSQPQEVQDLLLTNQPANHGKVVVKMDASGWQIVKFE